jgi:predicted AAA+ superfamily ATPase
MPNIEKEQQEKTSFSLINDSFKKIIVVKDNIKPKRDNQGIVTMGILDFLLSKDSLKV